MAVIQMPGRGHKDENGMITKWYKRTGDWVAQGDELFSFETEEGTFTVKSQKAGRLVAVFVPEGEIVPCPADVGMLATPSPDNVLRLGRQQYLDETKPLSAREPEPMQEEEEETEAPEAEMPEEISEAADTAEEDIAEEEFCEEEAEAEPKEAEEEPAEESEYDEAVLSEEELLEYVEEDLSEVESMEPEAEAEEPEEDEPAVSEEELLQYVEEDLSELEAMEAPEEELIVEEPAEEEPAAEAPEEEDEEEEPAVQVQPAAVRSASLTAQADMTVCMDIAMRTGVSLGAMVRFAAMHTGLAEYLDHVDAEGLRALDEMAQLPNVCDLSSLGVTGMNIASDGSLVLQVPAPRDAWSVDGGELEFYPCLDLTLAFDANVLDVQEAAALLGETCEKLENLLDLLI